ncbi:uncharacterized protein SAPINGB_P006162 [Magnusiomyces paraingens]|uniref:3beta-hydroxysteroid 3-dehydrogenase n=1 Tax=Magnusiomyces paraingens TaxID=2606893 RepID=A0A5E8C5J7_9ASCO|nr:uncharacterized protein SAPINGB_P006162 [Saprochaete ingens]VVT58350.1 unnamed protein product [Saprochaete ingens]
MSHKVVLITGGQGYLGLSIAKRIIDDTPKETRLTIIITSRTFPNIKNAIKELKAYVLKNHLDRPALVEFDYVTVDLADMVSVCAALRELELRYAHIDTVVFNACLALYDGIDWVQSCVQTLQNPVEAFTYARYKIQRPVKPTRDGMGSVFQANVFAPWFILRRLTGPRQVSKDKLEVEKMETPVLGSGSKVFWISSLTADTMAKSPSEGGLDLDDIDLFNTPESYEASKREIDLLHHATAQLLKDRYGVTSLLVQPGIFKSTSFVPTLNVFAYVGMLLAFYLCRWLGSPYHNIDPWKAANAVATLDATPNDQINLFTKYGSATDRRGREYVMKQVVPGLEQGFDEEEAQNSSAETGTGAGAGAGRRSAGEAYKLYLYVEALYKVWEERLAKQVVERYLF